jgi:uncharacterized protein (DUF433 family)
MGAKGETMPSYDNYVECRPGHNGGYPVLKRLNVSVRVIVELSRQVSDVEELRAALPQCTADEISAALDYYHDHPRLVDEDIERNRQILEKAAASKWPA